MILIEAVFYATLFVISTFYIYSICAAIKKANLILLIYNLVMWFAYCIKPILTNLGYYVEYSGIDYISWVGLTVFFLVNASFISGQFFKPIFTKDLRIVPIRYLKSKKNNFIYILILVFAVVFLRGAGESAQEYNQTRLEFAHSNGVGQLLKDTFLNIILFSITYSNLLVTISVVVLALLFSGTKQAALASVLLYLTHLIYVKKLKLNALAIIVIASILTILLVLMQIYRSHLGFSEEIDASRILLSIAIPFDPFDNGMKILSEYNVSDFPAGFLFPYSIDYMHDYFLQLIPRFIWESKPEVYGFWVVMAEHLPGLYSGPTGMSASLSAPVDVFYGFGLVFGLPIIFLFGNFLNSVNRLDINKIYYPFLLCGVIGFTRSGLQIIPVIMVQFTLITLAIVVLRRGKNA